MGSPREAAWIASASVVPVISRLPASRAGFLIARIGERVHLHRCAVRKRLIQERLDGLSRFPCAYVPRFRRQRRHTQGQGQYEGQEQFSHVVRLRRQGSYRPLDPCLGGEPPPKPPASAIRFSSEQCSEEKRIAPVASEDPTTVILTEKKDRFRVKKMYMRNNTR